MKIEIYTDGSWHHMKKHMGIGIYGRCGDKEISYSKYIGIGTGNIAELTAIKIALRKLKNYPDDDITIYSDSEYSIHVLTGIKNFKKNIGLINEIKSLIKGFQDLKLKWVKGHDNNFGNNQADILAKSIRKEFENKLKGD